MMVDFDLKASLAAMLERQDAEGCVKVWEDLARYREVIARYGPDVVLETGTFRGGSARWFADAGNCDVISVDLAPLEWCQPRLTQVVGDSTSARVVVEVREQARQYARPLVVLDSDHSMNHVLREMEAYSPLVPVGGYLVVEDTIVRHMPWEHYRGSPWDAVDDFLARDSGWEVDGELEGMFPVTMHPSGWLRRVS